MKLDHHSPSSLNLFCASPAMYVLERVLGHRQPVGTPAHRGTAVEAGVALGLMAGADDDASVVEALKVYDRLTALSADARRATHREDIDGMVRSALAELRPYGKPSSAQGKIVWQPEGLAAPILGYYDFRWDDHGLIVDLKTTERLPSEIKVAHARQVALYAVGGGDNFEGRLSYVTPKKRATYRLENTKDHLAALASIARVVERFLSLSDDPAFFTSITVPDLESFYWGSPVARQKAFETWAV